MSHSIAIIGMGPRGVYALEHLTTILHESPQREWVNIHVIEAAEFGAGAVYRTDQAEYLVMNTICSQLTAYADKPGPWGKGPTMYEWMRNRGVAIDPNEYPSRAEHGRYLVDAFRRIVRRSIPRTTIHTHHCRAIDIAEHAGRYRVVMEEGHRSVIADAVLLTTGHSVHASPEHDTLVEFAEAMNARGFGKTKFLPTAYMVEQNIEMHSPTTRLGIIGLGLTSVDAVIAASVGKGGRFERGADDRLVYHRSGQESIITAWSLPGLPPAARAFNQKGVDGRMLPHFLTKERIDALRTEAKAQTGSRQLDFASTILPLLLMEMEYIYYTALCGSAFGDRYLAVAENSTRRAELLAEVPASDRFNWDSLADPLAGKTVASRAAFRSFLLEHMAQDVAEARRGNVSGPLKAALDVLRDLRGNIRYAVEYGGLTASSQRWLDTCFWPLHNRIVAGPPFSRIEEIAALVEAGVLTIDMGPAPVLETCPEEGCFKLVSRMFPDESVLLDVVVDGRVQAPVAMTDTSRLMTNLLSRGLVRPFVNSTGSDQYQPCGIDVTPDHRVIGRDGVPNDRLCALGIMNEGTQLYTFIAAAPGVGAKILLDAGEWAIRIRQQISKMEEIQANRAESA